VSRPEPREEARRWLAQAENDLAFTEHSIRGGFHAQACFSAQQVAEKAVKAVHYLRGARAVIGREPGDFERFEESYSIASASSKASSTLSARPSSRARLATSAGSARRTRAVKCT